MAVKKNLHIFIPVTIIAGITGLGLAFFAIQEIGKNNNKNVGGQDNSAITRQRVEKDDNNYSRDKYPLVNSVTGALKEIKTDNSVIIISSGKNYNAIITPSTEIFRNGQRTQLSAIGNSDLITIMGRQKNRDSQEMVADTVYANIDSDDAAVQL